jgi:ergothioneine biosynthesis protein EgtB
MRTPSELEEAWARSDRIFGWLEPSAWRAQPIALRQPFIFYVGHLPCFAWNHLGRGLLGRPAMDEDRDALFARGIDPLDVDAHDPGAAWPPAEAVVDYRERVRARLRDEWEAVARAPEGESVARMVLEHELMHHETLLYMLQELDHGRKRPDAGAAPAAGAMPGASRPVAVPGGRARLGVARGALPFAWDNEHEPHDVDVPAFRIDSRPVRNADVLEFVEAGGYGDARFWDPEGFAWRARRRLDHPWSWRREDGRLFRRGLFADVPLAEALEEPASVSWAEAAAFARWRGARLPTEAEYHRAAHGDGGGAGGEVPAGGPWGVHALGDGGWEWTASTFAPFPGFTPLARYPEYSADFFDGRHYVLLGGSWATHPALRRPSFRNWFQPHYPYVFAKFRLVR